MRSDVGGSRDPARAGRAPVVARAVLAGCAVVLAGAGLAGCAPDSGGTGGSRAEPTVRPPVPVDPASTPGMAAVVPGPGTGAPARTGTPPGGAAPATGAPNGAPTGGSAGTTCPAGSLSLAQLPGGTGAAGQLVVAIGVTNGSARTCTLTGYPDFTLTAPSRAGQDIDEPVTLRHGPLGGLAFGDPVSTVALGPGGRAGFLVQFGQVPYGDGGCVPATKLHLPLDGLATPVVGPVTIQVCGEPMLVSPFVPAGRLSIG